MFQAPVNYLYAFQLMVLQNSPCSGMPSRTWLLLLIVVAQTEVSRTTSPSFYGR
jgi:hypothetical protein